MRIQEAETIVQSRTYRLTKPGMFEEMMIERYVETGEVVVEPALVSICHADLRYYTGNRRPEALAKKLPMALFHEGIGLVVESKSSQVSVGQRVVVVPNIPRCSHPSFSADEICSACRSRVGENYCTKGRFLGSGTDGMAQNRLVLPSTCAIPIPDQVPDEIAVLAELCTVSYQALQRIADVLKYSRVAVFGDGPVGYLTAAIIHHLFGIEKNQLQVFGAIAEKLDQFEFAERSLVTNYDFAAGSKVDVAVECTGGRFSADAINQAIQILNPGGILVLMGVTEELVPINTRDILEKGITVIGSSRSYSEDYLPVLAAMKDPAYQRTLRRLLPNDYSSVRSIHDLSHVMVEAAKHKGWKKSLLKFIW